jgi:hypothetical protein
VALGFVHLSVRSRSLSPRGEDHQSDPSRSTAPRPYPAFAGRRSATILGSLLSPFYDEIPMEAKPLELQFSATRYGTAWS